MAGQEANPDLHGSPCPNPGVRIVIDTRKLDDRSLPLRRREGLQLPLIFLVVTFVDGDDDASLGGTQRSDVPPAIIILEVQLLHDLQEPLPAAAGLALVTTSAFEQI